MNIKLGTRVQDNKWGGQYVGTVVRISTDRKSFFIQWEGSVVEDELSRSEFEVID